MQRPHLSPHCTPRLDAAAPLDTLPGLAADAPGLDVSERFRRLHQRVPGFAGFLLNPENTAVIVQLTDRGDADVARRELPAVLRQFRLAPARTAADLPLTFARVAYDWRQLEAWQGVLVKALASDGGLRSFDVDEAANRVNVGVADAAALARAIALLTSSRIPAAAMHVFVDQGVTRQITLNDPAPTFLAGYALTYAGKGTCTGGFLAGYNEVFPPKLVWITASHCSATFGALDNGYFYQPTTAYPSRYIGREISDRAPYPCTLPNGTSVSRCRYSDATYILVENTGIPHSWQFVARPQGPPGTTSGSTTVVGTFDLSYRAEPLVNQQVSKVGRVTGYVTGRIRETGYTSFDSDPGYQLYMVQLALADYGCGPGDSGAPIITAPIGDGSAETVGSMGIHLGTRNTDGRCVFSPMINIRRENGAIEEYSR